MKALSSEVLRQFHVQDWKHNQQKNDWFLHPTVKRKECGYANPKNSNNLLHVALMCQVWTTHVVVERVVHSAAATSENTGFRAWRSEEGEGKKADKKK